MSLRLPTPAPHRNCFPIPSTGLAVWAGRCGPAGLQHPPYLYPSTSPHLSCPTDAVHVPGTDTWTLLGFFSRLGLNIVPWPALGIQPLTHPLISLMTGEGEREGGKGENFAHYSTHMWGRVLYMFVCFCVVGVCVFSLIFTMLATNARFLCTLGRNHIN